MSLPVLRLEVVQVQWRPNQCQFPVHRHQWLVLRCLVQELRRLVMKFLSLAVCFRCWLLGAATSRMRCMQQRIRHCRCPACLNLLVLDVKGLHRPRNRENTARMQEQVDSRTMLVRVRVRDSGGCLGSGGSVADKDNKNFVRSRGPRTSHI